MTPMCIIPAETIPEDGPQRSETLARVIEPLFAHEHPFVVAAALGDLTATLLAGYQCDDKGREELIQAQSELIRHLLPAAIERLNARLKKQAGRPQ